MRTYHHEWFVTGPRGCGRTTALAAAVRQIRGTMICAGKNHMDHVSRTHKIPVCDLDSSSFGLRGPFIADHRTIEVLTARYENRIRKLEEHNKRLIEKLLRSGKHTGVKS